MRLLNNSHKRPAAIAQSVSDVNRFSYGYEVINSLADGDYYLEANIQRNPVTGNVLGVFSNWTNAGHTFAEGNKVSFFKSTNDGRTFGVKGTAYDPSGTKGTIDCGGGFDSFGKYHGFVDTRDGSTPGYIYFTTTNDGTDWSITDLTSSIPADGLVAYRGYGNLIENNGVLMYPLYKQTAELTTTNSARYVLRSTDYGANWSFILVSTGTTYINEGTIIGLDNTRVLYIARNEATNEFRQYLSSDNGLTWTDQGDQSFGETFSLAGPPRLNKFQINGSDVIVCYYPNRADKKLKAIYGTAANLISNGLTGWNSSTITTITTTSGIIHYGDVYHRNNTIEAVGLYTVEQSTIGTTNTLTSFTLSTTHYQVIKTALGL